MSAHPLARCEWCRGPLPDPLADCARVACQQRVADMARALARAGGGPDWPAPEVPARPAEEGEVPAGARRLVALARAAGWHVVATYARGTYPGRSPRVVDSLALRMSLREPASQAVAVWHGTRFTFATIWGADRPLTTLNVTQLREALGGPHV